MRSVCTSLARDEISPWLWKTFGVLDCDRLGWLLPGWRLRHSPLCNGIAHDHTVEETVATFRGTEPIIRVRPFPRLGAASICYQGSRARDFALLTSDGRARGATVLPRRGRTAPPALEKALASA